MKSAFIAMAGALMAGIVLMSAPVMTQAKGPPAMPVETVTTEPFEVFFSFQVSAGDKLEGQAFAVPDGKRFVVEHVTAYVRAPSGSQPIQFAISVRSVAGQPSYSHQVIPVFIGTDATAPGQPDRYAVSQLVRWYSVNSISVLVERSTTEGIMSIYRTITGHLVDE